jgi:hypothetical protein
MFQFGTAVNPCHRFFSRLWARPFHMGIAISGADAAFEARFFGS